MISGRPFQFVRSRHREIVRFEIDPVTGKKEITPEYRRIVTKAFMREARNMKRAHLFHLFRLYVGKLFLEYGKLPLALCRYFTNRAHRMYGGD